MLKRVLIGLALILPQVASAADLPYRHARHARHPRVERYANDRVIRCTTTDFLLVTYSNCGQSYDPFSAAAGR